MEKIISESERLLLREMTLDDVPNLQRIFSDPIAMQYYPATKGIEETERWIRWNLENYQRYGHGLWAVELKETRRFVGQCGLVVMDIRGIDEVEIGYLFVRDFWGRGYATEAAATSRDMAFRDFGYRRVVSFIGPTNTPSQRVATRIGLELEVVLNPDQNKWKKVVWVYALDSEQSTSGVLAM